MQYVLGELLGVGGMGRVFIASHPVRPRVAIKFLHEALASDAVMVARLREEAEAAQSVRHTNVVRVYDHGMTGDGVPFIAMERYEGVSLGALIQRTGPLPLLRLRKIATEILAGLGAIHRAGLVHGDIKSDNIIIGDNDRVTIIDFGLARRSGMRATGLDDQMLSGTPEYMAPETIRGEPITPAADLYAVGTILYELLTGTTPFGGGTATAVFERHVHDEIVPPSLRCPDRTIPVSLEAGILRALEKDPSARHLNAELFATAIDRAIPLDADDSFIGTERPARSAVSPTREWPHGLTVRHVPHARRRFAEGTMPRDSAPVARHRKAVAQAIVERNFDRVIVSCLGLAEVLVGEQRLVAAARELEAAISWLAAEPEGDEAIWRLQLTLAAIYDGLGDRDSALRTAVDGRDRAKCVGARTGYVNAQALLRRLGVERAHRRR